MVIREIAFVVRGLHLIVLYKEKCLMQCRGIGTETCLWTTFFFLMFSGLFQMQTQVVRLYVCCKEVSVCLYNNASFIKEWF